MTELLLIIAIFTIGLAALLIVVEGVGLRSIVRRCDADAKTEWRNAILSLEAAKGTLKEAKRTGEGDTVVESCRLAITQARENLQTERKKFDEELNRHVDALQDRRRKSLDKATENTTDFYRTELTAKWTSIGSPTAATVISVVGAALLLALVLIDIRYYNLFSFNVFPYLPDYPAPALLLGLSKVLLLLGLLLLLLVASVVIVPPLALLRLIRIVNGVRAWTAKGIARFSLAACGRSTQCSKRALPLLDNASPDSVSVPGSVNRRWIRRSVETTILFVTKYGSKLIPNRTVLIWILWTAIGLSFIAVCYIAVVFEPRYQFHAICGEPKGARNVRVILDPPLAGEASFTRIGSIGGNVFIVREFCGRQRHTGDEKAESQRDGQRDSSAGRAEVSEVEQEPRRRIEAEANSESNGEEQSRWPTTLLEGLQYVVDQVKDRLEFYSSHYDNPPNYPAAVTVVPSNRVLCMHEVHQDGEAVVCEPPLQPHGSGLRIIVHETTENTIWTIVVPADVQVRMDNEWRLKGEIAQRLCSNGASAEISEPILFEWAQTAPADEQAARKIIKAFLNKPELKNGKLHVLGFASGDGGSLFNERLARQRAQAIVALVKEEDSNRTLIKESFGESHLTNGVANSRSVRLVGCQENSEDSSDSPAQQTRAATSEPREQGAVVR